MMIEIESMEFKNIDEMNEMFMELSNNKKYKLPCKCEIDDINGWKVYIGSDKGTYDGTWIKGISVGSENRSNKNEAIEALNKVLNSKKFYRYTVEPYSEKFSEFVEELQNVLPQYHSTYGHEGRGGMYSGSFVPPSEHL